MKDKIINYVKAAYPGLYLVSHEEQRVIAELMQIVKQLEYQLFVWSAVDGLVNLQSGKPNDANDPLAALMEIEKLYYCIFQDKVMLFFKDQNELLNCYEIEEKEIVETVKTSSSEDIEKILQKFIDKENLNH